MKKDKYTISVGGRSAGRTHAIERELYPLPVSLDFPDHTLICHPGDERYFKDRGK